MIKIVTDSSTLYSVTEAEKIGLKVIPLSVTINNKSYREFEDISSLEFIDIINDGHLPRSSQPAIGEKEAAYQSLKDHDVIDFTMADGLSGTYQSSLIAKDMIENNDYITIVNTKTLCGPHRYIVNKALELVNSGLSKEEVLKEIYNSIENSHSFLVPCDFDYLKRGGRLSPLAATLGGLMRIVPILELSKDGRSLNKFGFKKTFKKALNEIINQMKENSIDETYDVSISHAINDEWANLTYNTIKEELGIEATIYHLSPAFITQGGPGCVAIQYIKK